MNWDDFRVFLAVAETGQLKDAARLLQMDPITVGRRITRLEAAIGATLFARSPKGYQLLPAAQAVLDAAAPLSDIVEDTRAAAQNRTAEATGPLRISAPDGCATYILPRVLKQLSETHPALKIEIVSSSRTADLLRREVDIAIALAPSDLKAVQSRKLTDYNLWLCGGPTGGTAAVGYIPELSFDVDLGRLGHETERGQYLANAATVQVQMVENGLGQGYIHDFMFAFHDDLTPLAGVPPITRSYYLLQPIKAAGRDRLGEVIEDFAEAFNSTTELLQSAFSKRFQDPSLVKTRPLA